MSNANRDYAIVYDVKNSSLALSRPLVFYITDKNTSNIFVRLVTRINIGDGIDQYTDIENATNYALTMRVIKPNNEIKSIQATQHEPESIFQFDLTEDFKDIPGKYICELTISTIVSERQELITSDPFNYEVKRSILSNVGEIIETEDTTVEKLLNNLDATKAELSSQIKEKANKTEIGTPLVAKVASEMVDTSKIYVYVGSEAGYINGNWYSYDGTNWVSGGVYNSQGIADKSITAEKTDFINIVTNDIAKGCAVEDGYLDASGNLVSSSNFKTTNFLEMKSGVAYVYEYSGTDNGGATQNMPRQITVYNSDKSFSRTLILPADVTYDKLSIMNENEKYVRVNMHKNNLSLKIYPKSGEIEEKTLVDIKIEAKNIIGEATNIDTSTVKTIVNDIVDNRMNTSMYLGKTRQPIICFILDGDYDMNSTFEELFNSNDIKAGFAPQYNTSFQNNTKEQYIEWQTKGHEILCHGSNVYDDKASYTVEEAEKLIKDSYNKLKGYGFDIKGFIGSSGYVASKYLPSVRKYFLYAATEHNTSGSYESCMYFQNNPPYKLFRYSMQMSTLEQMKSAVDKAYDTNGLLMFYGHAKTTNTDNFTISNIQALITYIKNKGIKILTPFEAVKEYYTIRYDDLFY